MCSRKKDAIFYYLILLMVLFSLCTVVFIPNLINMPDVLDYPNTGLLRHLKYADYDINYHGAKPDRADENLDFSFRYGLTKERAERLRKVRNDLFKHQSRPPDSSFNMNITLSDAISLDRTINDTRPPGCIRHYNISGFPTVSIIIPFYNEALSMLLRTVHSILNRTPPSLIHEIILVDDCSTHEYLKDPLLDEYFTLTPKTRLLRNTRREGLIRSRLRGSDVTSAPVIVFLDAHTEVNEGWLAPLLAALARTPRAVVQPFIDGVDAASLEYSAPRHVHTTALTWDLRFVWARLAGHLEESVLRDGAPFWAPTLVGCAIAVNRRHFYALGAFDRDQRVWGGENIELALRAWLCGGGVVTVPCSRAGHAFRRVPGKDAAWTRQWQKNLMRVADVWLDDYKRYFYSSTRIYQVRRVEHSQQEKASLQKRLELKARLNCKPFQWYLDNIVPGILAVPPHDAVQHGEVTNYKSHACWTVLADGYLVITYTCYEHKTTPENVFSLTRDGLLLYRDRCVKFMFPTPNLRVVRCPRDKPDLSFGVWSVRYLKRQDRWAQVRVTLVAGQSAANITQTRSWCVAHATSAARPHNGTQMPQLMDCAEENLFMVWTFTYRFDYEG